MEMSINYSSKTENLTPVKNPKKVKGKYINDHEYVVK